MLAAAVALLVAPSGASDGGPNPDEVVVGVAPDRESALLAAIMTALLDAADVPNRVQEFSDRRGPRQALELGAVDVIPGYTGEAWLDVLGRPDPPGDPLASYRRVRDEDAEQGLRWMRPTFGDGGLDAPPANATFAFMVQDTPTGGAALEGMTQFASRLAQSPDARVCVDEEFGARPDGLPAVWRAYSVSLDFFPAAPEDAVLGVAAGDCLAGLTTATDGDAWSLGLRPLVDDREIFPAFVVTPVVREEVADRDEVLAALQPLPRGLTTRRLGQWNAQVASGEPVEEVAARAAEILRGEAG